LPTPSATELMWLAVSPDDTCVIVSAATYTSDIWLLEQFEPPRRALSWIGR